MASDNGMELYDFNKNHFCFSAVLSDGEKFVYVSVSDVSTLAGIVILES